MGSWLNVLPGLFGVLGLLVASVTFIRGGYIKARLDDAESYVERLRGEAADDRLRITDRDAKIVVLETQVATLLKERDMLERMKSGANELAHISTALDKHHEESMAAWTRIIDLLETRGLTDART